MKRNFEFGALKFAALLEVGDFTLNSITDELTNFSEHVGNKLVQFVFKFFAVITFTCLGKCHEWSNKLFIFFWRGKAEKEARFMALEGFVKSLEIFGCVLVALEF